VACSVAGLAAALPVLFGIAAAVKLDSPGPVFFGHERVGRHGRRFRTWKFRTMEQGAKDKGVEITAGGDPRVTRIGRLLRATKLDELPQLLNVLAGEMSLVGPRPEVAKYVEIFQQDYDVILSVRPGITDEASIAFRQEEQVLAAAQDPQREYLEKVAPQKIALYRRYVDEMSLGKDLSIIIRTIWKVLSRD
jgi:lipopolysaccharide/colanic/teichoic acid biosynthesis glycosyltransferase